MPLELKLLLLLQLEAAGVGAGKTAPPLPDGTVVLHDFHCLKISTTSSSNRSVSQMNESSPSTSSTSMISIAGHYPPKRLASTAMIRTLDINRTQFAAMIRRFLTPCYRAPTLSPFFFLRFLLCNLLLYAFKHSPMISDM